jgi:hypothetical protein
MSSITTTITVENVSNNFDTKPSNADASVDNPGNNPADNPVEASVNVAADNVSPGNLKKPTSQFNKSVNKSVNKKEVTASGYFNKSCAVVNTGDLSSVSGRGRNLSKRPATMNLVVSDQLVTKSNKMASFENNRAGRKTSTVSSNKSGSELKTVTHNTNQNSTAVVTKPASAYANKLVKKSVVAVKSNTIVSSNNSDTAGGSNPSTLVEASPRKKSKLPVPVSTVVTKRMNSNISCWLCSLTGFPGSESTRFKGHLKTHHKVEFDSPSLRQRLSKPI